MELLTKVIFLDIDGVLLSMRTLRNRHLRIMVGEQLDNDAFDVHCVKNLNLILDHVPEAKIVISSSWRLIRDLTELGNMLSKNGIDPGRLVGKTPDDIGRVPRGKEIQAWLDVHPEVESYIILDDDSDMLDEQKSSFIKISGQEGLTDTQAVLGISLLQIK